MFERFKRGSEDPDRRTAPAGEERVANGRTAVAERPTTAMAGTGRGATRARDEAEFGRDEPATRTHAPAGTAGGAAVGTREHMHEARARQRDEYGGINWGAAFFGWLVAVGLGSLLLAIVAAAGAAVGLTQNVSQSDATSNAESIGLGGAIALLVVLMIAYYCGGYVAGRMSRFDGARQGFGAWMFGIIVTILLALAAVLLGSEYNVLEQLNLPSLPVGDATLTTGGAIALAAVLLGTLLAAIVGGKAGERYHRKVDRVGFVD
jgi:amino acid transporter